MTSSPRAPHTTCHRDITRFSSQLPFPTRFNWALATSLLYVPGKPCHLRGLSVPFPPVWGACLGFPSTHPKPTGGCTEGGQLEREHTLFLLISAPHPRVALPALRRADRLGCLWGLLIQCFQVVGDFLEVAGGNDESRNWVLPAAWGMRAG